MSQEQKAFDRKTIKEFVILKLVYQSKSGVRASD